MPKINQEEYEKIKLLPDYDWNWIAREKTGKILSFTNKPAKTDEVWKDKQTRLWFNYKDSQLFQFIQWEDEEPYNIQKLIEEYERYEIENIHVERKHPMFNCNRFNGFYNANIAIWDRLEESEETEVKNLEWAKNEIKGLMTEESQNYPHDEMVEQEIVLGILNQLDEPETLSQEWLVEHSYNVHLLGTPDVETVAVPRDNLEGILVPKQEVLTDEQIARKVDQAYKDGYEKGKQHTFYKGYLEGLADKEKEPETVASVMADFFGAAARLKEVLAMEVEELEE